VTVVEFEIIRPLRLLDLTALSGTRNSGSLFQPGYSERWERAMFLRSLSGRMTRPVMPDDEGLDYLATQAVADFLATGDANLDGIIFPSVQAAGDVRNVVLFHKASRVEVLEIPPGATISTRDGDWYEEGFEVSYQVYVETPPPPADSVAPAFEDTVPPALAAFNGRDEDPREPALRIKVDSLAVHQVGAVKYVTTPNIVRRVTHPKWVPAKRVDPF
jgi:hypothetical protein